MRSRLVVLTLSLYLAFAVIGCTSKPPASSGNDMNNQQSADNAAQGELRLLPVQQRILLLPLRQRPRRRLQSPLSQPLFPQEPR